MKTNEELEIVGTVNGQELLRQSALDRLGEVADVLEPLKPDEFTIKDACDRYGWKRSLAERILKDLEQKHEVETALRFDPRTAHRVKGYRFVG